MPDYGHRFTDEEIAKLTKEVQAVYKQASEEAKEKLDDYFRRFEIKDEIWARRVANGEKTAAEYAEWRKGQLIVGERWRKLSETLANDYHNANVIARKIVLGHRAAVYAENFNFATFRVEMRANVNTAFTLYNRDAVERILRDNPELLPPPGSQMQRTFGKFDRFKSGDSRGLTKKEKRAFQKLIQENKDIRWQEGQLQSVTMQSIAQGESIPNMAKRIATTMGEINHASTIRYARTAMNGAQNAGRVDAFHRAEELGVEGEQIWMAVLDDRTRHAHRQLDGQKRKPGEPFEAEGYEIMYPGDQRAAPEMYWNCRCTIDYLPRGWNSHSSKRSLAATEAETYDQWKNAHKEVSRPITYQEEMANAMRWRYIREDYKGK